MNFYKKEEERIKKFFEFSAPLVKAETSCEKKAADIFIGEIKKRLVFVDGKDKHDSVFVFSEDGSLTDKDAFNIECNKSEISFRASGIRGLIYAAGLFFRKSVAHKNKISLLFDISGEYHPEKKIRGHQLGYRRCSNTYDAWDIETYRKYYIDLMFFGANICEHIPYEKGKSERNEIMRYDEQELLCKAADEAVELGLDVSLWYPNSENNIDTALKNREKLFSECKNIDYVFCPGSDPGSLPAEEFVERSKKIKHLLKKYHPNAEIWPSAQQPHGDITWGGRFLGELKKLPEEIDGIITGPNRAFKIDVLRKHLPVNYPIRLYPDITHNLRCEYPVHFDRDDWHYALAATNGRESINPRPTEFKKIHSLTKPYIIGSVSYSEGVNDDINKAVWSALDFDSSLSVREILEDYARAFFIGADFHEVADGIFGLEKNWEGAPDENSLIEHTLDIWRNLGKKEPSLYNNWRYVSCIFRAECDAFVRRKILFENSLIASARRLVLKGDIKSAVKVLATPFPANIKNIRKDIEINAEKLYNMIGIQLSTKLYHASNFERGAALDTIDLPVTDRCWLRGKLTLAKDMTGNDGIRFAKKCINRNKVCSDEYYYSVALDGLSPGGAAQFPEFYINFQGDFPKRNNGNLPVCLFKLFDHCIFKCKTGGLKYDTDYILQVTYKNNPNPKSAKHTVKINGNVVYQGKQFGDKINADFETDFLPEDYTAVMYNVPAKSIINGCADIEISEPLSGFEIAELRLTKKAYSSETED